MTSLSALFRSFFKIGLFTFGGGYAMIPLIEAEIINRRGWLARDEFMELLTLAQSSPGPIAINTSVFIGYKTRGVAGAAAAVCGAVLPSFICILVIAIFFRPGAPQRRRRRCLQGDAAGRRGADRRADDRAGARDASGADRRGGRHGAGRLVVRTLADLADRSRCGGGHSVDGETRKGGAAMIYLQLFVSYLKIGFFGFGGGYAMLSLIQNEVVVQHAWMSNAEFADIVAVSQMTPGPIAINSATYVGYTVGCQAGTGCWCGILGSVIATFAVCLPSLTVMLLLTRFFLKLKGNRYIEGAMTGMKPVVIGMIAAAALLLIFPKTDEGASFIDGWSWLLFGICFAGSVRKLNPILLILFSAVAGIAIYYVPTVV